MKPYLFILLTILLFTSYSHTLAESESPVDTIATNNKDANALALSNEEQVKEPTTPVIIDDSDINSVSPIADTKSLDSQEESGKLESSYNLNLKPFIIAVILFAGFALIFVFLIFKHRHDNRIHNSDLI